MNVAKLFLFDIDTDLLLVLYLGTKMFTTLGFWKTLVLKHFYRSKSQTGRLSNITVSSELVYGFTCTALANVRNKSW